MNMIVMDGHQKFSINCCWMELMSKMQEHDSQRNMADKFNGVQILHGNGCAIFVSYAI
jgi:hypothetical protein